MRESGSPGQQGPGGLGRGLDALIPRGSSGSQEIDVERIAPSPAQPRQRFDADTLEELAASIREHGVLQPVIVRRSGAGYELIAGERRWRAAKLAGRPTIPAIVKDAAEGTTLELALVENLQRADLTPLEEAGAYRELLQTHGLTQEQVAARVGRSRVAVTNRLRLLSLPPTVRSLLADGSLSEGHARALLGCPDAFLIEALAARVVEQDLSVRQTEELVRRAGERRSPVRQTRDRTDLEEEIERALGTRVQIVRSRRGGRLVIHFYGDEQLDGILEKILADAPDRGG